MLIPIKQLILVHDDMPKGQGILVDEVNKEEFDKLVAEHGGIGTKGIPEIWTRIEGYECQMFPNPKDSEEFKNSGLQLAIIREKIN